MHSGDRGCSGGHVKLSAGDANENGGGSILLASGSGFSTSSKIAPMSLAADQNGESGSITMKSGNSLCKRSGVASVATSDSRNDER